MKVNWSVIIAIVVIVIGISALIGFYYYYTQGIGTHTSSPTKEVGEVQAKPATSNTKLVIKTNVLDLAPGQTIIPLTPPMDIDRDGKPEAYFAILTPLLTMFNQPLNAIGFVVMGENGIKYAYPLSSRIALGFDVYYLSAPMIGKSLIYAVANKIYELGYFDGKYQVKEIGEVNATTPIGMILTYSKKNEAVFLSYERGRCVLYSYKNGELRKAVDVNFNVTGRVNVDLLVFPDVNARGCAVLKYNTKKGELEYYVYFEGKMYKDAIKMNRPMSMRVIFGKKPYLLVLYSTPKGIYANVTDIKMKHIIAHNLVGNYIVREVTFGDINGDGYADEILYLLYSPQTGAPVGLMYADPHTVNVVSISAGQVLLIGRLNGKGTIIAGVLAKNAMLDSIWGKVQATMDLPFYQGTILGYVNENCVSAAQFARDVGLPIAGVTCS